MNRILVIGLCVVFVAVGGCKKGEGEGGGGGSSAASCPAATVTVDGEAFPVAFGLGYRDKTTGSYAINFYNQPGATCEEILAPMRQVPEGERGGSVFASEGGGGLFGSGVSLESNAQLGGKTSIAAKPANTGDPLSICVPDAIEWEATVGSIKGKKVAIQGLFTGSFCGER